MTGLRISVPGPATCLQDTGRFGYQRFGIPVSGALDAEALCLANGLVGAAADAAALEMRYLGPSFEVEGGAARIAFAGAELAVKVRRQGRVETFPACRSITLQPGDQVEVGPLRGSTAAIMAVAGGVDVGPELGSRATYERARIGGLDGGFLTAGQVLPLVADGAPEGGDLELPRPPDLSPPTRIRVVPGPQEDHFTPAAIETFYATGWVVSADADRMGLRLEGPELAHKFGYNITSDGIVNGAIQVPGTGRPILLLADRQTSGGYPKIATVISTDLPALGRSGTGAEIRFTHVTAAEGARIARARAREMSALLDRMVPVRDAGGLDLTALYREDLISPPIEYE